MDYTYSFHHFDLTQLRRGFIARFIGLLSCFCAFNISAQHADLMLQDSLINLLKEDTSAFLNGTAELNFDQLPGDFWLKQGKILAEKQRFEEARKPLEFLNRNLDSLVRPSKELNGYYFIHHPDLEIATRRELREVYIQLEEFYKALPLIELDRMTYSEFHGGQASCEKSWIESRKRIDVARCFFGLARRSSALDTLIWDNCFHTECFDIPAHFNVLCSILDSANAIRHLKEGFENPVCRVKTTGSGEYSMQHVVIDLIFLGKQIETPITLMKVESCDQLDSNTLDSISQGLRELIYFQQILPLMNSDSSSHQ